LKTLTLLLLSVSLLSAETIHSSLSSYFETKDYDGSKQKKDAVVYGVGADIHVDKSAFKATYEYARANTRTPPLKHDLKNAKLFLKYAYHIDDRFEVNINYINVLHDNIAITDDGQVMGAGITYNLSKKISANFTQFYSNYDDFDVYQSDLKVDFKFKLADIGFKLSSITKYINIDEENTNSFTKNAKSDYFTSGLKLHANYNSYLLGAGFYVGKRAFGVMQDGFKLQHHAMEFDRTYAVALGKSIEQLVLRVQYVYQRAEELPIENKDVKVKTLRFIANYKF